MSQGLECRWRKIRIGVDADTGQIIAAQLTTSDVDDSSQVRSILDLVTRPISSFTRGSVDDRNRVCGGLGRQAAVVIAQLRSTVVPSALPRPPLHNVIGIFSGQRDWVHGLARNVWL
jgi:hypothetical protein